MPLLITLAFVIIPLAVGIFYVKYISSSSNKDYVYVDMTRVSVYTLIVTGATFFGMLLTLSLILRMKEYFLL